MCSSGQGLFLAPVKLQQMDEVSTFSIFIPLFAGCKTPTSKLRGLIEV
ncbi:hypothetical protein [Bacillus manliponensis]